MAIVLLL